VSRQDSAKALYTLRFAPPYSGLQHYRIRAYPSHPLLSHRFEMGRMLWL
jgi:starch phosphorylase